MAETVSDTPPTVVDRITAYLTGGGLFNPELANHDAVRDLLIDAHSCLSESAQRWIPVGEQLPGRRPVLAFFRNALGNGRTTRAVYVKRWDTLYEGDEDPADCDCEADEHGDWYLREGWREDPVEAEESYPISNPVTHWMPLPEAPK